MANIFRKAINILRANFTAVPPVTVQVGVTATYPNFNSGLYVRCYNENASVYTIVMLMARKFATLPRYLTEVEDKAGQQAYKQLLKLNSGISHRKMVKAKERAYGSYMGLKDVHKAYGYGYCGKDADGDDIVNDPLMNLLNNPNPYQGQDSFYQLIYTYKKLMGNSFTFLYRGDSPITGPARLKLPVLQMYVLPAHLVTPIVNRNDLFGTIESYSMMDQNGLVYFQPEDILHWRDPQPFYDGTTFKHYLGMSPLEPGMPLITQDQAGRDAMVAMYQNGGARGVLSNPDFTNLSPVQKAAADSAIDTKINNRQLKSAVAMLPGTWSYTPMGDSAVDMDLVDAQDKVFQRICNLLGCNPQLFETKTTFNNVEQARKDLITNAIMPDACSYRDEENRVLLQAFGLDKTKYCIDIDATNVPELQDDLSKLTTTIMATWPLSPNEMRDELGYERSEEEGMDDVYILTTLTLLADAAVPTSGLSDDGTDGTADPADNGGKIPAASGVGVLSNSTSDKWDEIYSQYRN